MGMAMATNSGCCFLCAHVLCLLLLLALAVWSPLYTSQSTQRSSMLPSAWSPDGIA